MKALSVFISLPGKPGRARSWPLDFCLIPLLQVSFEPQNQSDGENMSICTHSHPLLCKDAQRTRIQHLADAFISIIPHSWHLGPRVCQSLPGVGLCPNQRYLGNTKELKALTSSAGKNPLNFVSLLYLKLVPPHGTFTSCNIRPSPTPFPL